MARSVARGSRSGSRSGREDAPVESPRRRNRQRRSGFVDDDDDEDDGDEDEEVAVGGSDGDEGAMDVDLEALNDDSNDSDVAAEDVNAEEEDEEDDDEKASRKSTETKTETPAEVKDESVPAVPVKRGRGRPVGSGKKRHNTSGSNSAAAAAEKARAQQQSQIPLDENGVPYELKDDELVLPEDPKGEEKVDKNGNLLQGRDYRVRTFSIPGRGSKLYMLSTEPARCMGFRDSYLLFQKHRKLWKIVVTEAEKFDLIEREIIPHSYKGRAIGVVTARSIFLEFGPRIVIGGRYVRDDYYEDAARAQCTADGTQPDTLADPDDILPPPGRSYNKNQYVAWHGASSVYHQPLLNENSGIGTGAQTPLSGSGGHGLGGLGLGHDSVLSYYGAGTEAVRDETWMYEHARAVSRFNSALVARRRQKLDQLVNAGRRMRDPLASSDERRAALEPHTGVRFLPQATQSTHARATRTPLPEGSPLVFSTVIQSRGRTTGLGLVSPKVYEESVAKDPELGRAITRQLQIEQS